MPQIFLDNQITIKPNDEIKFYCEIDKIPAKNYTITGRATIQSSLLKSSSNDLISADRGNRKELSIKFGNALMPGGLSLQLEIQYDEEHGARTYKIPNQNSLLLGAKVNPFTVALCFKDIRYKALAYYISSFNQFSENDQVFLSNEYRQGYGVLGVELDNKDDKSILMDWQKNVNKGLQALKNIEKGLQNAHEAYKKTLGLNIRPLTPLEVKYGIWYEYLFNEALYALDSKKTDWRTSGSTKELKSIELLENKIKHNELRF